jgi:hypothetical protein
MAIYKKTNNLSIMDAAYIAGLIDGEGTIALTRRHKNENRQLEISVSNTDMELLVYLLETIGAGRIAHKRTDSDKHTASGTYLISNRQALHLLEQVTPFLRTYKLHRAKLVLQDYLRLTPRNGKYSQETFEQRDKFIETFLNIKPG